MGKWVLGTGNREPGARNRELGTGNREMVCAYVCQSSPFDFALFLENPELDKVPAGNTIFKGTAINRVSNES